MTAYGTADFSKNPIPLWLVDLKLNKIDLKWIFYFYFLVTLSLHWNTRFSPNGNKIPGRFGSGMKA